MDKPAGPSSFALVDELRRRTGAKAGHAGTLDPFATGLLLVLLGAATRLARYLVGLEKRYVTDVDLSGRTSTGDPEGERLDEGEPPERGALEAQLEALRGAIELPIPAASAVKIGGERAYRLSRRGVAVDMPLRRCTVHELTLIGYDGRFARLDLRVSSGTYIRAIAAALGGHCASLRRTEVGPFSVEVADGGRILPAAQALPFLPSLSVSVEEAVALRSGRSLAGAGEGSLRLLAGRELVGVGRAAGGVVHPESILP